MSSISTARRELFLRLLPEEVIGDSDTAVLYRWIKTALNNAESEFKVDHVNFDKASFQNDRDVDAIFIERLKAYTSSKPELIDPYWREVLRIVLDEKSGLRFTETIGQKERHFYVFASCVFVSSQVVHRVKQSRKTAEKTGDIESHLTNLTDEERDDVIERQSKEAARRRQLQISTTFFGFSPKVNDGMSLQSSSSKTTKSKAGSIGQVNGKTYFCYIELRQYHKDIQRNAMHDDGDDSLDKEDYDKDLDGENGEVFVLKPKGGHVDKSLENIAKQIKKDVKRLFKQNVTTRVRMDIGDQIQSNSSHFNIRFNPTAVNEIKYDEKENKSPERHYYEREKRMLEEDNNLSKSIDKQIHQTEIIGYLKDTSDRCTDKQIVCRYYHEGEQVNRYIVYTVQVNGFSGYSGDAITAMAPPHHTDVDYFRVTAHTLEEYNVQFLLKEVYNDSNDASRRGELPSKLMLVVEDDDDESTFENEREQKDTKSNDPKTDPIRKGFREGVQDSVLLQFISHIYLSSLRSELGTIQPKIVSGNGKQGLLSKQSDPNFRFNTAFKFVHLLACASHRYECMSCSVSQSNRGWFRSKSKHGSLLNMICPVDGANVQRGDTENFSTQSFVETTPAANTFQYVRNLIQVNGSNLFGSPSYDREIHRVPTIILNRIREFYKHILGNLDSLLERGDQEEFFHLLQRRNFWALYARRIEQIHGYAYKEIVAPQHHETFLKELFYYQLRKAWKKRKHDNDEKDVRIPIFLVKEDQNEDFRSVIRDAHRTIFALRGITTYMNKEGKLKYTANLLENFGKHLSTSVQTDVATSPDKTAMDELFQNTNTNKVELQNTITHLMKQYKISDPMFIVDLQKKNTQLLFHFLHFVENNGALDTRGHLHVTYQVIEDMRTIIEHVVRVKQSTESASGDIGQRTGLMQWFRGTQGVDKIAASFFSMENYLTLDRDLIRHMQKSDGFRYMLQDWEYSERLMFIRIHQQQHSKTNVATGFGHFQKYRYMHLYAFLPTYVYLTREARNLLKLLTTETFVKRLKTAIRKKDRVAATPTKVQTAEEKASYAKRDEFDNILNGLLYFMKQQLIETSGTNVFIIRLYNKQFVPEHETDKDQQLWLFGQWHRQYVLYDLQNYIGRSDPTGLRSVELHPDNAEHASRKIYNILDDRFYESAEDMEKWVGSIRNAISKNMEQGTTVYEENQRRQSRRNRMESVRRRHSVKSHALNVDDPYGAPTSQKETLANSSQRKEKMLVFVKMIQDFVTKGGVQSMEDDKYPTTQIMWLLFRDLYTFTPGMYNHILAMIHSRLSRCEKSAMLFTAGATSNLLSPKRNACALHQRGLNYYVSFRDKHPPGTSYGLKHYLLQLNMDGFNQKHEVYQNFLDTVWTDRTIKDCSISTQLMLNLLIDDVGLLGQATDTIVDEYETEWAEVECMSWTAYLKQQQVEKWTEPEQALNVSLMLNGLFASNAVLGAAMGGGGLLSLGSYFMSGASSAAGTALSGMGSLSLWLSKTVLSTASSAAVTPLGIGMGLGAMLMHSGVRNTVREAINQITSSSTDSWFQRLGDAFGVIRTNTVEGVKKSTGLEDALSHVSAYLLCKTRILRINTKFKLNGVFYKWQFDVGVDISTQQILMYHGMKPEQEKHMTYLDAYDYESNNHGNKSTKIAHRTSKFRKEDIEDIRRHKKSLQSRRRSSSSSSRKTQNRRLRRLKRQFKDSKRRRARRHRTLAYGGRRTRK